MCENLPVEGSRAASKAAANGIESWAEAVSDEAWELLAERHAAVDALERAVASVPHPTLVDSLGGVASKLPLAVGVEMASIRVRESDGEKELRLMAAVGAPTTERRQLAVEPFSVAKIRTIFALGAQHSAARGLGLRWLSGLWLEHDRELLGSILVGSRTERRPSERDLKLLDATARELSARLAVADPSSRVLRTAAVSVARVLLEKHSPVATTGPLVELRPRERAILELYADGLSTREIAEVLVISPHTVRTHVRNALARLAVHSRDEAVELVRAARVATLL
jgi:DNA-binding CsgD family transcriptional regulator